MSNFVLLPISGECADYDCGAQVLCLPPFEDCDGTPRDSLLTRCDLRWNCARCETDDVYFTPYVDGERIQIQTLLADFASPDRKNPTETSWLTVELWSSKTGQLLTSNQALFISRSIYAWSGSNNYQIFEVDTSLFPNDCWFLKFVASDGRELCTQDFQRISDVCPDETIRITGVHEEFDCNGFYYGEPVGYTGDNFKYDNTIRLWAGLQAIPGTIRKERFGLKTISAVVRAQYRLVLHKPVPPYIEKLLLRTYLAAPEVRIVTDQEEIVEAEITSYSPRNRINYNNMLLFNADLFIECSQAIKRC